MRDLGTIRPAQLTRRHLLQACSGLLLGNTLSSLFPEASEAAPALPGAVPDGVAHAVVRQAGLEGRVLWLDGTANLERLSTREGVAAVLDKCVRARINTVVVDVKPLSGHVLYDSRVAPRLTEWRGFRYPAGHDLLRVVLEEGRKRGLKIHANINVFSDGHKLVRSGPIYNKPDQQSMIYDVQRSIIGPLGDRWALSIGVNRPPGDNEISVYDPSYRSPRVISTNDVGVVIIEGRVEQVVDGSLGGGRTVTVPRNGCLLVGRGAGADWIRRTLRPGDLIGWAAADRFIPIVNAPTEVIAAFFNPANPVSRQYLLRIVDEITSNYDIDGLVFDRMRYSSLQSDFSDLSRQQFEKYLGRRVERFPADIYAFQPDPSKPMVWGPLFQKWLEWRAYTVTTWLEEAVKIARTRRPGIKLGAYVGSWYGTYYTVGVNWASSEFTPGYEWMSPTYNKTGYAHLLDWITTGCYHPIATREQARSAELDETMTVQYAAEMSTRAIGDQAFVYAGLYVVDYKGSPEAFTEAIQAAREYSHGVMVFDLVHIEDYRWWDVLYNQFQENRTAPHDVPELVAAVRSLRKSLSSANGRVVAAAQDGDAVAMDAASHPAQRDD